MSLTEGTGANSRPESAALGEVLAFFGTVADYAAGALPDDGERIASLAVAMSRLAGLSEDDCGALYFAARLRNVGALGNPAFEKGEPLPERALRMRRWDVPAAGARLCERIPALPAATADFVRWQAECWDGTGYPDQLRWSGIPQAAQFLHIAADYVGAADPEEALSAITAASGSAYSPEQARTFVMWFHTTGGEIEVAQPPYATLGAAGSSAMEILETISACVDRHNGTPERAQRIARLAREIAAAMNFDADEVRKTTLAALLFGLGELRSPELESTQFDPLARLGVDTRANHALAASALLSACDSLADVAPIVRARSEWYDGTGGPDRLRHDAIPLPSRVLAASIAFDALDQAYRSRITEERTAPIARLETAAGTQFHPGTVRALSEVLQARA